jgi:hypothetical protein
MLCRFIYGNTRVRRGLLRRGEAENRPDSPREDGLRVFSSDEPFPENLVKQTIETIRRERDQQNFRKVN